MIITGAYRIKRALTDEEAKKINQAAGGKWFDRRGEPLDEAGLAALGIDEAGLERMAASFDYDKVEQPHDESDVALALPGYKRGTLNRNDKNLITAAKENGQNLDDYFAEDNSLKTMDRNESDFMNKLKAKDPEAIRQMDEEYMAAIESNDMKKARKLVNTWGRINGYNVNAWHGSLTTDIDEFKTNELNLNHGSHFGSRVAARQFATDPNTNKVTGRQYHVKLNAHKPYDTYDLFAQENKYTALESLKLAREIGPEREAEFIEKHKNDFPWLVKAKDMNNLDHMFIEDEFMDDEGYEEPPELMNDFRSLLKEAGYDSITYENDLEDEGNTDYVIQDKNRIKLADVITRDDKGNIIPLSQRFDSNKGSIRWSVKDAAKLDDEYMKAVESGDMETAQRIVDEAAKAAGYIYKGYQGSDVDEDKYDYSGNWQGGGHSGDGFYLADSPKYAGYYGKNVRGFYFKANNIADDRDSETNQYGAPMQLTDYSNYKDQYEDFDEEDYPFETFPDLQRQMMNDGFGGRIDSSHGIALWNHEGNIKSADAVVRDDNGEIIPPSRRFNSQKNDLRWSVNQKLDSEYEAALNSGDDNKARKMLDDAAKKAGYTEMYYHGNREGGNIDVFTGDPDVTEGNDLNLIKGYFTDQESYAEDYTPQGEEPQKVYLDTRNFLWIDPATPEEMLEYLKENGVHDVKFNDFINDDEDLAAWLEETGEDYLDPWEYFHNSGGNLTHQLKKAGFNGVMWNEGNSGSFFDGTAAMPFSSELIKSADLRTVDDEGHTIPLSQRFNRQKDSVRWSVKDAAQLDDEYMKAVKQLGDTDEVRNILQTAIKNNTLGKAPNGKQSNLEPAQWLMVRTKQFKDWFGDWEYISNAYPKNRAQGRNEVKAYIDSLKGKTLVSLEENIEAKLSKDGRSKIISDAALNKSLRNGFTISNHFTAVANLEELFKNSIKTNVRQDDGNNDSLTTIEHFSAPIVFEKEPSLVTFTVKVTRDYGRKIYSIELMELKKVEGKVQSELDKIHKATSTFDTLNISKIADTVNNCSKVVDENGEPLIVHHGTEKGGHNEFNPDMYARSEPVTWFDDNKKVAYEYARNWESETFDEDESSKVYSCFLNMRNPLIIEANGADYNDMNLYDAANDQSHDGILVHNIKDNRWSGDYYPKFDDSSISDHCKTFKEFINSVIFTFFNFLKFLND